MNRDADAVAGSPGVVVVAVVVAAEVKVQVTFACSQHRQLRNHAHRCHHLPYNHSHPEFGGLRVWELGGVTPLAVGRQTYRLSGRHHDRPQSHLDQFQWLQAQAFLQTRGSPLHTLVGLLATRRRAAGHREERAAIHAGTKDATPLGIRSMSKVKRSLGMHDLPTRTPRLQISVLFQS